jgi:hypothetical protein
VSKGRYLVSTLRFFQRATMKTHGLTTKIRARKPKNVRNCESWVNIMGHIDAEQFWAIASFLKNNGLARYSPNAGGDHALAKLKEGGR